MKNLTKLTGIIALVAVIGFSMVSCDDKVDKDKSLNLKYSVQVNNQAASRSISAEDNVELYIEQLYIIGRGELNGKSIILISDGQHDMGSKGGKLNNAGWYSVNAVLDVQNDVNPGPYMELGIKIWEPLKTIKTLHFGG